MLKRYVCGKLSLLTLGVGFLLGIGTLSAKPGFGARREKHQDSRIQQGEKSGELTKHESRKLGRNQKRIDKYKEKALSDGNVTRAEKYKLRKMEGHASRSIYRQKHDGQEKRPKKDRAVEAGNAADAAAKSDSVNEQAITTDD